jgi:hypothetical protein
MVALRVRESLVKEIAKVNVTIPARPSIDLRAQPL